MLSGRASPVPVVEHFYAAPCFSMKHLDSTPRTHIKPAGVLARLLGSALLIAVLPACGVIDSLKARRTAREGNALYADSDRLVERLPVLR